MKGFVENKGFLPFDCGPAWAVFRSWGEFRPANNNRRNYSEVRPTPTGGVTGPVVEVLSRDASIDRILGG